MSTIATTHNSNSQYLQEMGISQWELVNPERLAGYAPQLSTLPDTCKLLLVSPVLPVGATAVMFEKVLKSIHLDLNQAQFTTPDQLHLFDLNKLEWIWFAGCDAQDASDSKTLSSPLLSEIDGNNVLRRELWQQICTYQ